MARSGAYERVRAQGWPAVVYSRPAAEREAYRRHGTERIAQAERLFVRPHHLMCLACWYAGGEGASPRPNDTIYEILQRIRREPDVPITLVEGCCQVCDCCDGFHPETTRCVHGGGLIRDVLVREEPMVLNYLTAGRGIRLQPGLVLALEPMFNLGTDEVRILQDGWTVVTRDGKPSAHFEHTVAITESGTETLTRAN